MAQTAALYLVGVDCETTRMAMWVCSLQSLGFLVIPIDYHTNGQCYHVGQRKKVTAVTFFCSYLLPRVAAAESKRDKYGPNAVYRIGETRSQLNANNGIREIWQFKVFSGKEVTALPVTREEGGY